MFQNSLKGPTRVEIYSLSCFCFIRVQLKQIPVNLADMPMKYWTWTWSLQCSFCWHVVSGHVSPAHQCYARSLFLWSQRFKHEPDHRAHETSRQVTKAALWSRRCWFDFLKQLGNFGRGKGMSNALQTPSNCSRASGGSGWAAPRCEHLLYSAPEWMMRPAVLKVSLHSQYNNLSPRNDVYILHISFGRKCNAAWTTRSCKMLMLNVSANCFQTMHFISFPPHN